VPENGVVRWFPPEFLPTSGKGVLFLDELNLAAPVVQGVAQQLILDRRVGSYVVPDGWYIWAAGNRKEDRAAVFDMPAPLANRFIHVTVESDIKSFMQHSAREGWPESIVAFLAFRPELLHKMDTARPAWPSPRSWGMASHLFKAGLGIAGAVGEPVSEEFRSFLEIYDSLPDLESILHGKGDKLKFPAEPSKRYAMTVGLPSRAETAEQALAAFRWMEHHSGPEWTQLFIGQLLPRLRQRGLMGEFSIAVSKDAKLQKFMKDFGAALAG
jgi:hypothetical protein